MTGVRRSNLACGICGRTTYWCPGHRVISPDSSKISTPPGPSTGGDGS